MTAAAEQLHARLQELADPARAEKERAYLKSDLEHLGVGVPAVRREAQRAARPLDRAGLVELAEQLWARPVHECRLAAVEALVAGCDRLTPDDLPLLERLLREARTWALVDPLAANVVGPLVERHPDVADALDRWASDDDVWVRRSALLAQLVPLRRGGGDPDRFFRYADDLLEDRSFWVRKAIGWVLRDTARRRPELVGRWLLPRAHRAAGLTVREAVKHLPTPLRDAVLEAHRSGSRDAGA